MEQTTLYPPLPSDSLRHISDTLAVAYDLIVVTLLDSDVFIGALAKHWRWDGRKLSIGFNTVEGKRFGESHVIDAPIGLIADLRLFPLADESILRLAEDDPQLKYLRRVNPGQAVDTRLPMQDYPNPLATIIDQHNRQVAARHNLQIQFYMERALAPDAIPPEGIYLRADQLLYADWEFFARHQAGATSLQATALVATISKDLAPSLHALVVQRLKESWMEKLRRGVDSKVMRGAIHEDTIREQKRPCRSQYGSGMPIRESDGGKSTLSLSCYFRSAQIAARSTAFMSPCRFVPGLLATPHYPIALPKSAGHEQAGICHSGPLAAVASAVALRADGAQRTRHIL